MKGKVDGRSAEIAKVVAKGGEVFKAVKDEVGGGGISGEGRMKAGA